MNLVEVLLLKYGPLAVAFAVGSLFGYGLALSELSNGPLLSGTWECDISKEGRQVIATVCEWQPDFDYKVSQ